jgi:hypothetical protein
MKAKKETSKDWIRTSCKLLLSKALKYAHDEPENHLTFLAQHGLHPSHSVRVTSLTMTYLAKVIGLTKQ